MKKTLNVNLNGRVFTIDEDAYRLLDNYLSNLRSYFRKEQGAAEIINDFEARIEELFSEKTRLGYQVITLEHVEEVIARVGKPDDFAAANDENEKQTPFTETGKTKKKFFRNTDEKVLGGVCSGIATYFDWNVGLVRFLVFILQFVLSSLKVFTVYFPVNHLIGFSWGWIWLAYFIAWIIIPAARTVEQKLQMKGQPITVENIGRSVAAQQEQLASNEPKGCLSSFADALVVFIKICFMGLGCLIGLPVLFAFFVVIIVLIAVLFGVGGGMVGAMPLFLVADHPVLTTVTGIIVFGIPVFVLIYSLIAYIAKSKPMHQSIKWSLLIVWIVALVVFLALGFKFRFNDIDWNTKRNWLRTYDHSAIRGNHIPSQKTINFEEAVMRVETGDYLCANLQLVQTGDEMPSIEISGDENLVEEVMYELNNGRLFLSARNRILCDNNNLKIILRTGELKGILMGSVAKVQMDRAFSGDELEVRLKGVGNFRADSLYFRSLTVRTEGVGSANISGKADKTHLETAGVGKIDAMELLSDTVYAKVEGVGSIQCNPVDYLEGRTHGVGSITYKEEPREKNVRSAGVGKIKPFRN